MKKDALQKIGECLYRYSSNGAYYTRTKSEGILCLSREKPVG